MIHFKYNHCLYFPSALKNNRTWAWKDMFLKDMTMKINVLYNNVCKILMLFFSIAFGHAMESERPVVTVTNDTQIKTSSTLLQLSKSDEAVIVDTGENSTNGFFEDAVSNFYYYSGKLKTFLGYSDGAEMAHLLENSIDVFRDVSPFKFCHFHEKLKASLVCKAWYKVINHTFDYLSLGHPHSLEELSDLFKRFSNITTWETTDHLQEITPDHLQHLTRLVSLKCSHFNNQSIQFLNSLSNLTSLNLKDWKYDICITNDILENLKNLKKLKLPDLGPNCQSSTRWDSGVNDLTNLMKLFVGRGVTNKGIENLTNLRDLAIYFNHSISDESLMNMTNLTKLELHCQRTISDNSLKLLTDLKSLRLSRDSIISKEGISNLTNLTELGLDHNKMITDEALLKLTGITNLNLAGNKNITAAFLTKLKKLRILSLKLQYPQDPHISNDVLRQMTTLTTLSLKANYVITDKGLFNLTNLTKLIVPEWSDRVSGHSLTCLHNLTYLDKGDDRSFLASDISSLTNLVKLFVAHDTLSDSSWIPYKTAAINLMSVNNKRK